jgi:6-phosphogluconate dehydrogenase
MQLGMIGLGRMGANLARRLSRAGHSCVVYDRNEAARQTLSAEGFQAAASLADLVTRLSVPRALWVMLPAGEATEATVTALGDALTQGDIVIDGGNSFYRDDIRRGAALAGRGIDYVDVGTSGGVWGLERGYCLMVGGSNAAFDRLVPLFEALAPGAGSITPTPGREGRRSGAEHGYIHAGPVGAGHFVKMIHNGIEYGLMQAYAEGFDILANRGSERVAEAERYDFDLADIAEVWRRGSVVSSWLLDLCAMALAENADLSDYSGSVDDSGEGRWAIQAAVESAVPADVLSSALFARFRSRQDHTFGEKLLSAMRQKFGGHVERAAGG